MSWTFCLIESSEPVYVVVTAVGHEVFDETAGKGKHLHLVEDHERVAPMQLDTVVGRQV